MQVGESRAVMQRPIVQRESAVINLVPNHSVGSRTKAVFVGSHSGPPAPVLLSVFIRYIPALLVPFVKHL